METALHNLINTCDSTDVILEYISENPDQIEILDSNGRTPLIVTVGMKFSAG